MNCDVACCFLLVEPVHQRRSSACDRILCHYAIRDLFALGQDGSCARVEVPIGSDSHEDLDSEKFISDMMTSLQRDDDVSLPDSPAGLKNGTHPDLLSENCVVCCDVNSQLAGVLASVLLRSPSFHRGFIHYVLHRYRRRQISGRHVDCRAVPCVTWPVLVIIGSLTEPKKLWLDYKWNYRVLGEVKKRLMLEDAMNWLNTLGGGYSALGEHNDFHAEQAGNISLRQLKVALELGDPPTVIRCKLYGALSMMQRGVLRPAKHQIRKQYRLAKSLPVEDSRLLASCRGLWSKLAYLYKLTLYKSQGGSQPEESVAKEVTSPS